MDQFKADGEETWGSEGKHSIHLPEVSHRAGCEAAPTVSMCSWYWVLLVNFPVCLVFLWNSSYEIINLTSKVFKNHDFHQIINQNAQMPGLGVYWIFLGLWNHSSQSLSASLLCVSFRKTQRQYMNKSATMNVMLHSTVFEDPEMTWHVRISRDFTCYLFSVAEVVLEVHRCSVS